MRILDGGVAIEQEAGGVEAVEAVEDELSS